MKVAELIPLLALMPLALLAVACFLKFSIVLSLLGRALGKALPPLVVTAIAILLVSFAVAPIAEHVFAESATPSKAAEPVRAFLESHVPVDGRKDLFELQRAMRPFAERDRVSDKDLMVIGPAFAIAELKAAFRIGFFLLLPFLVIDLLIGVVLLGLGMYAVDARVIALPLKLLLFVAVDGWALIVRGLLIGYT